MSKNNQSITWPTLVAIAVTIYIGLFIIFSGNEVKSTSPSRKEKTKEPSALITTMPTTTTIDLPPTPWTGEPFTASNEDPFLLEECINEYWNDLTACQLDLDYMEKEG